MNRAVLCWLFVAIPLTAYGAEVALRTLDGSARFWWTFAIVQVLAIAGYCASSLKDWARWHDGAEARLSLCQALIASLLAGNITYYGGFYGMPGWRIEEIYCFIGASVAAYGGARYINALIDALISFVQTTLSRARPNGEPPK